MADEFGCEAAVVLTGERVGGFVAEWPVGVGDVPPDPVQFDGAGGGPPPATSVRILGRRSEGREQVARRVLLVDVDVLVGEVGELSGELSGELAVLTPCRHDRFGVGELLELAVDLGELPLEDGELGALPFEGAVGPFQLDTTSTPTQATPELVGTGLAAGGGRCEAVDVGCERVAPCDKLGLALQVGLTEPCVEVPPACGRVRADGLFGAAAGEPPKLGNRVVAPLCAADEPNAPVPLRRALATIDHTTDAYISEAGLMAA